MNKTRILRWVLASGFLTVAFVSSVILYVQTKEIGFIKPDAISIEEAPYAIVLGASVTESGNASDALMDRILTGVELYRAGKVDKILMTGDDGGFHIDEVRVMARIAAEQGVPATDLIVDGQGYRTYESCKRAKEVLKIDRAVVVTQRFHLARALYLCRSFGIDIQGLAADRQPYQKIVQFTIRDLLSSFKAWFDINIYPPQPPV